MFFLAQNILVEKYESKICRLLSPKFSGPGNYNIWKSLPRPLRVRSAMALVLNLNVLGCYTVPACVPSFMLLPDSFNYQQLSAGLIITKPAF